MVKYSPYLSLCLKFKFRSFCQAESACACKVMQVDLNVYGFAGIFVTQTILFCSVTYS